jgi:hypothetical protein
VFLNYPQELKIGDQETKNFIKIKEIFSGTPQSFVRHFIQMGLHFYLESLVPIGLLLQAHTAKSEMVCLIWGCLHCAFPNWFFHRLQVFRSGRVPCKKNLFLRFLKLKKGFDFILNLGR